LIHDVADLLIVRGLSVAYVSGGLLRPKLVRVVHRVSLNIGRSEAVAVIGESGSGKTTLARAVLRIERYIGARIVEGSIIFDGTDITRMSEKELRRIGFRWKVSAVFQDPYSSVNPFMKIVEFVEEPLILLGIPRETRRRKIIDVIREVGLSTDVLDRHPHELSGGQRQRVAIARALVTDPELLIADEPISMLDASIRVSILSLLKELKQSRSLAILYITHDIATARLIAEQAIIMYRGRTVEQGPLHDIISKPMHPYTQLLISAVPDISRKIPDIEPNQEQAYTEKGCVYAPRCPLKTSKCTSEEPPLEYKNGRLVACWVV